MKLNIFLLISLLSIVLGFGQNTTKNLKSNIKNLHSTFSNTNVLKEDIHSLVVSHKGKIVGEHYYNGFTADSLNNVKSITKGIVGLLMFILNDQGKLSSFNKKAITYFQDCNKSDLFKKKSAITIKNLLMMRSGIRWNNRALVKDDWWFNNNPHCFLLNRFPMDTLPGKVFSYNSANSHLLSGIVRKITNKKAETFAKENLFNPLGIKKYRWSMDNALDNRGNSEIYLTPRDMIKIGELMLHKGKFKNKRIIKSKWLKKIKQDAINGNKFMKFSYSWMIAKTKETYVLFTGGSGGQHIFIVPEKDLVIVTTGHWNNARSTLEIMRATLNQLILKS